jgi:hypothetical protein
MSTTRTKESRIYDTVDPEQLRAYLRALVISAEMADQLAGVAKGTVADIISRRSRRDVDGMVQVETLIKRKIFIGLSTVKPIFVVKFPPQGPPVRRSVSDGGPASTCPHCGGTL